VVLSSCPQIRYPDCYGIDMSELGKFVAFEAAVALRRERGQGHVLRAVYDACRDELSGGGPITVNHVKQIYEGFSDEEISARIAAIVRPPDITWTGEIRIVYQTVAGLRWSIPHHNGDWYFTGDYPTPGGYRVVAQAYLNYLDGRQGRSYEVARG
jgi:amidophosphoribosyltransferase